MKHSGTREPEKPPDQHPKPPPRTRDRPYRGVRGDYGAAIQAIGAALLREREKREK